ncbi:hypothetical protein [Aliiruegeria sabulilitoris]|uniref:hypothetical protein n=1 Tax=Aliiruegeria sabulilitoris TaxID=1510458 RepID=UPI001E3D5016|nr:hypothetical protein [Aliiruegeria sabulilitoris]
MRKAQMQGVHHITLTGADRQSSIYFRDPMGLLVELACYRSSRPWAAPMPM